MHANTYLAYGPLKHKTFKKKRAAKTKLTLCTLLTRIDIDSVQGKSDDKCDDRFLEFRRYHNFANLFSKLSESTFYKEISKFQ